MVAQSQLVKLKPDMEPFQDATPRGCVNFNRWVTNAPASHPPNITGEDHPSFVSGSVAVRPKEEGWIDHVRTLGNLWIVVPLINPKALEPRVRREVFLFCRVPSRLRRRSLDFSEGSLVSPMHQALPPFHPPPGERIHKRHPPRPSNGCPMEILW